MLQQYVFFDGYLLDDFNEKPTNYRDLGNKSLLSTTVFPIVAVLLYIKHVNCLFDQYISTENAELTNIACFYSTPGCCFVTLQRQRMPSVCDVWDRFPKKVATLRRRHDQDFTR